MPPDTSRTATHPIIWCGLVVVLLLAYTVIAPRLQRPATQPTPDEVPNSQVRIPGGPDAAEVARSGTGAPSRPTATQPAADSFVDAERIARGHLRDGELDRAAEVALRVLAGRELAHGPSHPLVASTLILVGRIHRQQGAWQAAETALLRALAIRTDDLGETHVEVAAVWLELARLESARDRNEDALEAAAAAREACAQADAGDATLLAALRLRAEVLIALDRAAEAEAELRPVHEGLRAALGRDDHRTGEIAGLLGLALWKQNQRSAAERLLRDSARALERDKQADTAARRAAFRRIAAFYADTGDRAQEALWRGRLETLPAD